MSGIIIIILIIMTDALVKAGIKNNLTSPDQIRKWGNHISMGVSGTPTAPQIKTNLDNILSNTTIKRACCLGGDGRDPNNFRVNVRIPIPANYSSDIPKINKDFGYIDKSVMVPSSMCNGLPNRDGTNVLYEKKAYNVSKHSVCDDFYSVYCANMLDFYEEEYKTAYPGQTPDLEVFATTYKPECACYARPIPDYITFPVSPLCILHTGCTKPNNDIGKTYLDPSSRNQDNCPRELVICNQVVNFTDAQIAESTISPTLIAKCGRKKKPPTSETSPTPTPIPTPTPTPTPTPITNPETVTEQETEQEIENETEQEQEPNGYYALIFWIVLGVFVLLIVLFGISGSVWLTY